MSYFKPAFSFVLCQVVYHCERARCVCGWDFKYRWWIESPLEGSASLNSLSFFTEILLTESFFFFGEKEWWYEDSDCGRILGLIMGMVVAFGIFKREEGSILYITYDSLLRRNVGIL